MNKGVVCSGTPQEVFSDRRTKKIFGMLAGMDSKKDGTGFVWKPHKKHPVNCGCDDCSVTEESVISNQ